MVIDGGSLGGEPCLAEVGMQVLNTTSSHRVCVCRYELAPVSKVCCSDASHLEWERIRGW